MSSSLKLFPRRLINEKRGFGALPTWHLADVVASESNMSSSPRQVRGKRSAGRKPSDVLSGESALSGADCENSKENLKKKDRAEKSAFHCALR